MGFQPLLELARRIRPQADSLGGLSYIGSVENGGLQQNRMHIFRDLGIFSPHDPGHGHLFFPVADHQHLTVQRAQLAVQGLEPVSLLRPAHHNPMPGDGVQIKGMHRLPILLHHVIGDVHQIIDGTDAAGGKPLPHPLRRRPQLDVLADPCTVPGAKLRILYLHADIVMNILLISCHIHKGRHKGLPEGSRRLSGDSQHAVAVHPVAGDFIFKHRVVKPQQLHRISPYLSILFKYIDALLRSLRIHASVSPQLLYGAHHALRGNPPQLPCLDPDALLRKRTAVMPPCDLSSV